MTTAPTAPDWQPFHLPGAVTRTVRADTNGSTYQISVWLPEGTPPPQGFPVIYVLDANALFATFVEAIRRSSRRPDATGVQPTAVVGIGWPGSELYAAAQRHADYTPGPAAGSAGPRPARVGGALPFLGFIQEELAPALQEAFPLDTARRTLFGHSLAGFFVLQALVARPGFFHTYAAISPSLWWDPKALDTRLGDLRAGAARVFIGVGEWEGTLPPWQRSAPGHEQVAQRRGQRQMVAAAREFAGRLAPRLGPENVVFRLFPDEDHASVLLVATQRVLRLASAC